MDGLMVKMDDIKVYCSIKYSSQLPFIIISSKQLILPFRLFFKILDPLNIT